MKRLLCQFLLGFAGLLSGLSLAQAKTVVVSIPPLAGMVQPLLSSQDKVVVLLKPGQSPHTFQLKPSQLFALHQADLVLGVGTEVDVWLAKAMRRQPNTPAVWMRQLKGVEWLPARQTHSHHHDHEDHDDHEDNHLTEARIDPHIWLSPHNAQLFVDAVSRKLHTPKTDVKAWQESIHQADQTVAQMLAPYQKVPFMVLHDAFHYFEHHYGLNNMGVVQLNPTIKPSIRYVLALRKRIEKLKVRCLIKEPQFPETQLNAVVKGLSVKVISADPLGQKPVNYDQFLLELSHKFKQCLM